ncbi:YiaA/YiaB family inner membrane protein [Amycolatopsis sp. NPDC059657]|uniref:YiaA/YiaB family inner membrane protein n=1 Tax=Amycolatopsis sp. NPDC059657 TaxID=3346899 RepID=UPI00366E2669
MTKTVPSSSPTTTAFYAQAALSFGLALVAVTAGIIYLPVSGWVRAFLAVGMLYLVTSAFTLAKVIRDRQEDTSVTRRIDQARLDKLLAEHDPFKETV